MKRWSVFNKFKNSAKSVPKTTKVDSETVTLYKTFTELYYKEIAIQSAVNIISNAICNSEFQTYYLGKIVKLENYYLFNIAPNQNENQFDFVNKIVSNLVYENECLIIQEGKQLYVADSFFHKKNVFYDDEFSTIIIDDKLVQKKYRMSDVIFLKLHNKNIKTCIDSLYDSYGELLSEAMKSYLRNIGFRGKVKIDSTWAQTDENQDSLSKLIQDKMSQYMNNSNAVLPEEDGFSFTPDTNRSNVNAEEINKIIEKIYDMVSTSFLIPKSLLKGDLADVKNITTNFLTFCVDPFARLMETEINKKYFRYENYKNNTKLKIDTSRLEHINIFDVAPNLDKMTSNGWSHDEQRELLGKEPLREKWSEKHFITKNYGSVEDLQKGGDSNE